ncbi:two-component system, response regulator YesN [Sporobacter termitidis DSM 10068]|uniref:Stage 0 sporulation protein A homolog n=1 Tax=Sporobacter termitidis DSM 10068 TaxID=1123282 RepID=A0A1M5U6E5_9FIRM|nr:response regulator [Sporobacter termitidis]SHH58426.1 two-component system, response regulator YesN [Sporobacter termitidis DSM 10068]
MYKTMIVDDYDIYHNDLKALDIWGEKSGFVIVSEASSGREALSKLYAEPVDLLITDIRMPVVDGIELTKKVFEERLCKCVILMSQFSDFEYARQGIAIGAFEYLLKPVEEADLMKTLQRAHAYISERDEQLSKIDYLNHVLVRQVSDHYPTELLKLLVKNISEASGEASATAKKMLETIWSEVGFDLLKSAYVINRVLGDLMEAVDKEYSWMSKLSSPAVPEDIDFSKYAGFPEMEDAFLDIVGRITGTVSRFELGIGSSKLARMACKYVLENIDAQISLMILSKKLFISSSYLSLLFKEKTGRNLIDYITFVKMERAKILLADFSLKNYEIADKLGFSVEYFSKLFKKTFNVTPTKYRSSLETQKM